MDSWKVTQLLAMLKHETNPGEEHYGANLSHWDKQTTKPILIDAGGLRALIDYYSTHDADYS